MGARIAVAEGDARIALLDQALVARTADEVGAG